MRQEVFSILQEVHISILQEVPISILQEVLF